MGKFRILVGDITSDEILKGHDLIINPTNPRMVCGLGVSGAIFHKANVDKLEEYTANRYNISYFNTDNLMEVGEIRITPGFELGMDIMFVQGPIYFEHTNPVELLIETYNNMLKEIKKNNYKNVLLPSLGTGSYGFTHEEMGHIVTSMLNEFVSNQDINIDLVLYQESEKYYYE